MYENEFDAAQDLLINNWLGLAGEDIYKISQAGARRRMRISQAAEEQQEQDQ